MNRYRNSRVFPIALLLIAVAVSIAALISLARVVFWPSEQNTTTKVDTAEQTLLSSDVNNSVQMRVRMNIVGNEDFRSYKMIVTPQTRTFVSYKGYSGEPIDTIELKNTPVAYEEFAYALKRARMIDGTQFADDKNDLRGICATGTLYVFEVRKGSDIEKQLWTSTCSDAKGSLRGSYRPLHDLFVDQIPDAAKLIRAL